MKKKNFKVVKRSDKERKKAHYSPSNKIRFSSMKKLSMYVNHVQRTNKTCLGFYVVNYQKVLINPIL